MSSIFDSFDDEDEIFQTVKVAPTIIKVSDAEKSDPLRRAKVEIGSFLAAYKVPMSVSEIKGRMIEMDGCIYNYKALGFKTLDELLNALVGVVSCHRGTNGSCTYSAVTTDANKHIKELVENQKTEQQLRSFFYSQPTRRASSHCSVFRNKKGERIPTPEEYMEKKKACYARDEEKLKIKSRAMSVERVQDIARFIDKNRSDLERISEKTNMIRLIAVQKLFLEKTGLPLWGKVLDELALNNALNVAQHMPFLKITNLDEDYFVDTIQNEQVNTENTEQQEPPTPSISSFHQQSANTMSLFEVQNHPIEEPCPGFRSDLRIKKEPQESRLPTTSNTPSNSFAPGSQKFGRQTPANGFGQQIEANSAKDAQDVTFGNGEQFSEPTKSISRRPRREITQKIFGESTVRVDKEEKGEINVLKNYIRERRSVPYLDFSPNDQLTIDHSKCFSVETESFSETVVVLNPKIDQYDDDIDNEFFTRSIVESDIRWLAEVMPKTNHHAVLNVQLCAFVPPRGVLFIGQNAEDNVSDMCEHLKNNVGDRVQVKKHLLKVGKPYIYVYTSDDELSYFRVIVMGEGDPVGEGNVRVLFMDLADSHLSSVSYRDLLELPEEFSHKKFPPTVQWAVFTALAGTKNELQPELEMLLSASKTVAVFYPSVPDSVPYIDLIVTAGGNFHFFSKILLSWMKTGMSVQDRANFMHYNEKFETLLNAVVEPYTCLELSGFVECEAPIRSRTASVSTVVESRQAFDALSIKSEPQVLEDPFANDSQIDQRTPEKDPMDEIFLKFKDMVMKRDLNAISLYQTIRSMAEERPISNDVFQQMRDAMKNLIRNEFENLF